MAVTGTTFAVEYTGDGATTAFPVPFGFLDTEHLRVKVAGTVLGLGAGYTVSGSTVTLTTAPASGAAVEITRIVPLKQLVDFRTQGPFSPEMWERAADLLTMICQQINGGVIDVAEIVAGETNFGQNVNGAGIGVYDGKSGAALQFRGVAGDTKIAVTYDGAMKTIRVGLGTVGPSDVGAAPASLSGTVSTLSGTVAGHATTLASHDTTIANHESRIDALELEEIEAEYVWDGASYKLLSSHDPNGQFPSAITPGGAGSAKVQFATDMPNEAKYTVLCTTGLGVTDGNPCVASYTVKAADSVQLRFRGSADGLAQHVAAFSIRCRVTQ